MNPDLLNDRIQAVLRAQANRVPIPPAAPLPGSGSAPRSRPTVDQASGRGRPALLAACILVAAVLAGVVLAAQGRMPFTVAPASGPVPPPGDRPLVLDTGAGVRLEAASLTVDAGGRTFDAKAAAEGDGLTVSGDPGIAPGDPAGGYTTLELVWFEDGVEMRVNLYFASDGTDWWVNEIRTYDGDTPGEWIGQVGEFFRSPLHEYHVGDIDLGGLHIADAALLGFAPPATSCDGSGPAGGLVFDPGNAASLDGEIYPEGGSGYAFVGVVRDAESCEPVPLDGFETRAVSGDVNIAEALADATTTLPRLDVGEVYVTVDFRAVGQTDVRIEVVDPEDNRVLAAAVIPVTVVEQ